MPTSTDTVAHRLLAFAAILLSALSPSPTAYTNHRPFARRIAPRPPPMRRASAGVYRRAGNSSDNSSSSPTTKRVVLVGGGHAHVQVIKSLNARSRPDHLHVTLVDPHSSALYSGMVPGCVSGLYALDQAQIALDSLAGWLGIEFVRGRAMGISFEGKDEELKKSVLVERSGENGDGARTEIPFDVVSLNIGSSSRGFTSVPGAIDYAIPTRPISVSDLVRRIQKEEDALKKKLSNNEPPDGLKVVVIGAGAAGIELRLALRARWNDFLKSKLSIALIDSGDMLLPLEVSACRLALEKVLEKYKIKVCHNLVVDEVTSSHVHVSSNADNDHNPDKKERIPFTHCLWATGAEAVDLCRDLREQCGLSVSPERGWIRLNRHLQSLSHPFVFAACDCCEIVSENGHASRSPPKAGVYAVRSGPILVENLTRFLDAVAKPDGGVGACKLVVYHPQYEFMKLLMCGDRTALGFRFGIPFYGKWVWQLKDHIDRMFVDLFDVKNLPTYSSIGTDEKNKDDGSVQYDTSQYDAYEATNEQMNAEDASKLRLRTDDDVDFHITWNVLRDMMTDERYKQEVLSVVHGSLVAPLNLTQ